jgi:hypothetical protein
MAKRRTRKQKKTPKHHFTIYLSSTSPEAKNAQFEPVVKRQSGKGQKRKRSKTVKKEMAEFTAKPDHLASVKRDIGRSLLLASLILALEIVIYLGWSR